MTCTLDPLFCLGDLSSWGLGRVIDITTITPFQHPGESVVKINGASCFYNHGMFEMSTYSEAYAHSFEFKAEVGANIREFNLVPEEIEISVGGNVKLEGCRGKFIQSKY